jgi:hypothetical protein
MIYISCDLCGKAIRSGKDHHYVVKFEVFAAHEPAGLTEDDLDEDHLEAVSQILCDAEGGTGCEALPPPAQQRRYDLCCACRERFLRDPLGKETAQKFDFSEN